MYKCINLIQICIGMYTYIYVYEYIKWYEYISIYRYEYIKWYEYISIYLSCRPKIGTGLCGPRGPRGPPWSPVVPRVPPLLAFSCTFASGVKICDREPASVSIRHAWGFGEAGCRWLGWVGV